MAPTIAEVTDKDQSMIVIEMLRRRRPELAIVREAPSRAQPAQPKEPLALRRRAIIAITLAALAIAGACHTDTASPATAPAAPAPATSHPVASQSVPAGTQPCGSRTCAAGELCDDLFHELARRYFEAWPPEVKA